MGKIALYRKYRSQNFEDLVGQLSIVRTLQNSLSQGRVSHAYLFTGPRGTGKTSTARILAKSLNCLKGSSPSPCNQCITCQSINNGSSMDVLEMDAASESGVDDIRETVVRASDYRPTQSKYKIFIIDEVHDLSSKAFDALLKTIEEPPAHVIFILATTELHKVPPTIQSRCQKFQFRRASIQDTENLLKKIAKEENIEVEPAALNIIARMADGGYRDAVNLLEQAALTSEEKLTLEQVYESLGLIHQENLDELVMAIVEGNSKECIESLEKIYQRGNDPRNILEGLLQHLMNLTRAFYNIQLENQLDSATAASYFASASRITQTQYLLLRRSLTEAHKTIKEITLPKVWLEMELVKLCEEVVLKNLSIEIPVQKPALEIENSLKSEQETITQPIELTKEKENPGISTDSMLQRSSVNDPQLHQPLPSLIEPQSNKISINKEPDTSKNWNQVVLHLSAISKSAAAKLLKTSAEKVDTSTLRINFQRKMDLDWVLDKPKLQAAITTEWENITQEKNTRFEYVLCSKKRSKSPLLTEHHVEIPAQGEALAELAKEVFKNF